VNSGTDGLAVDCAKAEPTMTKPDKTKTAMSSRIASLLNLFHPVLLSFD
jgi:hypothetical protein